MEGPVTAMQILTYKKRQRRQCLNKACCASAAQKPLRLLSPNRRRLSLNRRRLSLNRKRLMLQGLSRPGIEADVNPLLLQQKRPCACGAAASAFRVLGLGCLTPPSYLMFSFSRPSGGPRTRFLPAAQNIGQRRCVGLCGMRPWGSCLPAFEDRLLRGDEALGS